MAANWLLLRGLTREAAHWGRFPEVLAQTLEAKTHLIDLPGVGTERGRKAPGSIAANREDIRNRWLALRDSAGGDWGLLTISLGGMIGLDWLAEYPSDFTRGVVINSSAANLSPPWERLSYGMIPRVLRAARFRDAYAKERHILQMTTHMQRDLDERAREWAEVAKARPVGVAVAVAQLRAALAFKLRTPIRVPTLVLNSLNDRFTHPSCSMKIARALGAPIVTHSFAGHDIPLDDPDWVAAHIKSWLTG